MQVAQLRADMRAMEADEKTKEKVADKVTTKLQEAGRQLQTAQERLDKAQVWGGVAKKNGFYVFLKYIGDHDLWFDRL